MAASTTTTMATMVMKMTMNRKKECPSLGLDEVSKRRRRGSTRNEAVVQVPPPPLLALTVVTILILSILVMLTVTELTPSSSFVVVEGFSFSCFRSATMTRTRRTTTTVVTTTSLPSLLRTINQQQQQQQQEYGSNRLKNMVLKSSTTRKEAAATETDSPISKSEPSSSSKPTSKKDGGPMSYNQGELETKFPKFPRTYVPLASTLELDPNRPTPVEVFGQRYMVYQHPITQNWIVMDDTCPHRLAPLSEGRIILPPTTENDNKKKKKKQNKEKDETETNDDEGRNESSSIGNIQCSYHGWTYNSDGQCTSIPQASSDVERAALESKNCRVPTYSTIIDRSVIWFWPWKQDAVEATLMNAAATPTADGGWDITPSGLTKGCPTGKPSSTYTRELPYSYDILVENLLDPSHVPFAHHGLQGSRTDAMPIEMSVPSTIKESGFSFDWTDRTMGMMRRGEGRWQAPFTVIYDAKFYQQDPVKDFNLAVLCIPVRPGWSRAILFSPGSNDDSTDTDDDSGRTGDDNSPATKKNKSSSSSTSSASFKTKLIKAIFSSIPVWVVHQLNSRFLDSDLAFLHFQELERSRRQKVISATASPSKKSTMNGAESYFMPAASDRCISALRSWFTKYTDNMSGFGPLEKELPKSEMFDRWTQHTSKCIHCQNGLKQLAKTRKVLFGITALSLLGINKFVFAKILFLISLAAQPLITKIENSFKDGGFKHYENH